MYTDNVFFNFDDSKILNFSNLRTPNKFWEKDYVFFLLSRENFIRRIFIALSTWPGFDWTIFVAIVANCIQMALQVFQKSRIVLILMYKENN